MKVGIYLGLSGRLILVEGAYECQDLFGKNFRLIAVPRLATKTLLEGWEYLGKL